MARKHLWSAISNRFWVNHLTRLRRFPVHECLLGKSSPRMKAAASQSPPTHARSRSPNTPANNASASTVDKSISTVSSCSHVVASLNPLLGRSEEARHEGMLILYSFLAQDGSCEGSHSLTRMHVKSVQRCNCGHNFLQCVNLLIRNLESTAMAFASSPKNNKHSTDDIGGGGFASCSRTSLVDSRAPR